MRTRSRPWTGVLLLSVLSGAAVSGCQTRFSIERLAELDSVPDASCLQRELENSPDLDTVTFGDLGPASGSGRLLLGAVYAAGPVSGYVNVVRGPNGGASVEHSWFMVGSVPSPVLVDRVLRVMAANERRFESTCGIAGLTDIVVQECTNVACPTFD